MPLRRPRDQRRAADAAPAILGHEGCGVVEAVGPEVTGVKVGDRVIGSFIPACGACWFCLRDESHLCANTYAVMGSPRGDAGRRHAAHGHDRPRHLRRHDDVRRELGGQDRDRRPRRAARAHRLRCHHRRRRGTQHRGRQGGRHRGRDRLRRRGPVGDPGRPDRRRGAHHRHRPRRAQARRRP